ncbi:MAG: hypothetical protein ACI87H_002522 [Gammaproteobacteria bacterium]|jgi:hypothetical protein
MFGRIISVVFLFTRFFAAISTQFGRIFAIRFDKSRIDTISEIIKFIHTRSAYVAQTSLYGYLKTRMGTRYRVIFEDDAFQEPLNTAKWRTYSACLADLTVFTVGTVAARSDLSSDELIQLAGHCFATSIEATFDDCTMPELAGMSIERFSQRIGLLDWRHASEGENAFTYSPLELIDAAPVIDEFKTQDSEIVSNSIRFRWRDVREQLRKRIDASAICTDWRARGHTAESTQEGDSSV